MVIEDGIYRIRWWDNSLEEWRTSTGVRWTEVGLSVPDFYDARNILMLNVGGIHVERDGTEWTRTQ